jgi:hypothetical protein
VVGREGAGEAGSSGRSSWVGMQGRPQAVAMRCRWSVRKEEVLGINTKGDRFRLSGARDVGQARACAAGGGLAEMVVMLWVG